MLESVYSVVTAHGVGVLPVVNTPILTTYIIL